MRTTTKLHKPNDEHKIHFIMFSNNNHSRYKKYTIGRRGVMSGQIYKFLITDLILDKASGDEVI